MHICEHIFVRESLRIQVYLCEAQLGCWHRYGGHEQWNRGARNDALGTGPRQMPIDATVALQRARDRHVCLMHRANIVVVVVVVVAMRLPWLGNELQHVHSNIGRGAIRRTV